MERETVLPVGRVRTLNVCDLHRSYKLGAWETSICSRFVADALACSRSPCLLRFSKSLAYFESVEYQKRRQSDILPRLDTYNFFHAYHILSSIGVWILSHADRILEASISKTRRSIKRQRTAPFKSSREEYIIFLPS